MLRVQVAVVPNRSVATQVTVSRPPPTVRVCGKAGDNTATVGVEAQLSTAEGDVNIAEVIVALQDAPAAKDWGVLEQLMVGGVFSRTSIVKVQVLLLAGEALSNTKYCKVVTPIGKVPVRAAGVPLITGVMIPVVLTTVGALMVMGPEQSTAPNTVVSSQGSGVPVQGVGVGTTTI